jgi:hypothetical protein
MADTAIFYGCTHEDVNKFTSRFGSAIYLVPKLQFGNAYRQALLGVTANKTSLFLRLSALNVKQSLKVGIPKPELGNEK